MMNEFHRWKGERLKEERWISQRMRRQLMVIVSVVVGVLAIVELLFVVWVMTDGRHW
ncbi:hypothetical protein [Salmonella enterica]|uniref:hypothetical protein n=1 Tax=Salmonella enterica TaxID=28901 RepID=UPI001591894F|nr:hypothetical protein [Salmonella enterica]